MVGLLACTVVIVVFAIVIYVGSLPKRHIFSSVEEMKPAVEGVYTCYDGDEPRYQLKVSADRLIIRKCEPRGGKDTLFIVRASNPSQGTIEISRGLLVVTSTGDIVFDGDLYEKGGQWVSAKNGGLDEATTEPEIASEVLVLSNIEVINVSESTVCTGTIKNTGRNTYRYVKVRGIFEDDALNQVDTAVIHAIGLKGLAPREIDDISDIGEQEREHHALCFKLCRGGVSGVCGEWLGMVST